MADEAPSGTGTEHEHAAQAMPTAAHAEVLPVEAGDAEDDGEHDDLAGIDDADISDDEIDDELDDDDLLDLEDEDEDDEDTVWDLDDEPSAEE